VVWCNIGDNIKSNQQGPIPVFDTVIAEHSAPEWACNTKWIDRVVNRLQFHDQEIVTLGTDVIDARGVVIALMSSDQMPAPHKVFGTSHFRYCPYGYLDRGRREPRDHGPIVRFRSRYGGTGVG
jgi:hypothetical protein